MGHPFLNFKTEGPGHPAETINTLIKELKSSLGESDPGDNFGLILNDKGLVAAWAFAVDTPCSKGEIIDKSREALERIGETEIHVPATGDANNQAHYCFLHFNMGGT